MAEQAYNEEKKRSIIPERPYSYKLASTKKGPSLKSYKEIKTSFVEK